MALSPEQIGTISVLASVAAPVIKHVIPIDKINKAIPWINVIGGVLAGGAFGHDAGVVATLLNALIGGLAGGVPTVGHQLLVKQTPLKNVAVPKWWDQSNTQGL